MRGGSYTSVALTSKAAMLPPLQCPGSGRGEAVTEGMGRRRKWVWGQEGAGGRTRQDSTVVWRWCERGSAERWGRRNDGRRRKETWKETWKKTWKESWVKAINLVGRD